MNQLLTIFKISKRTEKITNEISTKKQWEIYRRKNDSEKNEISKE